VALVLDRADVFPDNWIYVHSPEARVGRIQNFKNWSPKLIPDLRKTSLGMEYFCSEGDDIWTMGRADLTRMAADDLACLGFADHSDIEDTFVFRQPKAYPVYRPGFQESLAEIRRFLEGIENLQTIGRNGMHRYNNMDHSMLSGILAARNLLGESHDLWQVNTDEAYHEAGRGARAQRARQAMGDRQASESAPLGRETVRAEPARQSQDTPGSSQE
jgi:protoporphyrinogen oxidase